MGRRIDAKQGESSGFGSWELNTSAPRRFPVFKTGGNFGLDLAKPTGALPRALHRAHRGRCGLWLGYGRVVRVRVRGSALRLMDNPAAPHTPWPMAHGAAYCIATL
jgi:hypothetical protein